MDLTKFNNSNFNTHVINIINFVEIYQIFL